MKMIRVHYFFRLLIYWLLFFAMFRLSFILYHHAKIPDGTHDETVRSFIHGVPVDLAVIGLLMIFPFILWTMQQYNKSRLIHMINIGYHGCLITFLCVISIFNIKLYGEHERLLSTEELAYLLYPGEAVTFLSVWSLVLLLIASAFFAFVSIKAYRRYVSNFSYPVENNQLRMGIIAAVPLLVITAWFVCKPAEGENRGTDFSPIHINNDIATNPLWFLGHSF
jgi:hypothetical protein